MPKIPSISKKKILKLLKKAGFIAFHQKGSYVQLVHSVTNKKVTIAVHGNKDLKKKTLYSILNQANIYF